MKNLINLLLFSISVILIFVFCSGDDDYYFGVGRGYSNSLFAPELLKDKDFESFFRTPESLYYGDSAREQGFYRQNIKDWSVFFDKKVDTLTIRDLLYKTKLPTIDTLIFYTKNQNTKISEKLLSNSLLSYQDKTKVLDFLYYLGYALRCEIFANNRKLDWDYEAVSFKGNDLLQKLIKGGIRQEGAVSNSFIKERYLFQICRLYYFNEDYSSCIKFFKANKSKFIPKSNTFYRALGYTAAALYKQKSFAEANYYYAYIFQNCLLMQEDAIWSFHPEEEADFQKSISMATNKFERATLYFMMGYYNDPLRALNEIEKIDVNSKYLPVLLTRAINIEEENKLNNYYDKMNVVITRKKISSELLKSVQKLCALTNTTYKPLYRLALGYLYTLSNDIGNAEYNFKIAEKLSTDSLFTKSIELYRAINHIQSKVTLNVVAEKELLPSMNLILANDSTPYLRKELAQTWLHSRMSQIYKKQGEEWKAECWSSHSIKRYYEKYENLDKMIAFIHKTNKSAYEQLLAKIYTISEESLWRAKILANVYSGNLETANALIAQGKRAAEDSLLGNPFIIHINDCHDCDHQELKKKVYTTESFVKKIIEKLKQSEQIDDKEQKAKLLFEVANAYYNITYFGNSRTVYETNNLTNDYFYGFGYFDYSDENNMKLLQSKIFDCKMATNYYQKALQTSNNLEFKAKCTFMLAKCEQNEFYRTKPVGYKGDFKAGKYFVDLKNNYNLTHYYKEIIRECGYFATYLKKKR